MISISSVPPDVKYDTTCLLDPGDHPFIKHQSYVVYSKPRVESADTIKHAV
jgi:hypothetical protein